MSTTAAALLEAWEAGAVAPMPDRATSLLESLGALPDGVTAGELTVGQCDARLFALRRAIFGETLEVVANCPDCDTEVELDLDLAALQPPISDGPLTPVAVHAERYTVVCRIPSNLDLSELAAGGTVESRDLVGRCALEVRVEASPVEDERTEGGRAMTAADLPDSALAMILDELAKSDPGACTTLRVRCPCGSEFVDELDIRSVVWTDLTDYVGRTLTEVHQLAQAYGWSEREILSLDGWMRRWYLEACGW
jgi:hypothetical protein